jgi:hypothetical protein
MTRIVPLSRFELEMHFVDRDSQEAGMIATSHSHSGRIRFVGTTILVIVTVCSGGACASAGWNRSAAYQPTAERGHANVVPGSWERVDGLATGTRVAVTLNTGQGVVGRFQARRLEAVVMTDAAGNELSVPIPEILRITAPVRDKLTNGALIGAGIGFGTAIAALAIAGSGDGYVLPSAKWAAPLLLSSVSSIAGMVVDRIHRRQELIYTAPLRATP